MSSLDFIPVRTRASDYKDTQFPLPAVHLKIKFITPLFSNQTTHTRFEESKVLANFQSLYNNTPLRIGDVKQILIGNTTLGLTVKKFTFDKGEPIVNPHEDSTILWILHAKTALRLNKGKYASKIIHQITQQTLFKVICDINLSPQESAAQNIQQPIFINHQVLLERLQMEYSRLPLYPGVVMEYTEEERKMSVIVKKIVNVYKGYEYLEGMGTEPVTVMSRDLKLSFESNLALGKSKIYDASTLIIQIVAVRSHDTNETRSFTDCFFADDIMDALIEASRSIVWKAKPWIIHVPNRKGVMNTLEIEILGGCDATGNLKDADPDTKYAKLWKITSSTVLSVTMNPPLSQIKVVHSSIPAPVSKIYLLYDIVSRNGVNTTLYKDDLIEKLRTNTANVIKGDRIFFADKSRNMLEIHVEDINFSSTEGIQKLNLGVLTPETEFHFTPLRSKLPPLLENTTDNIPSNAIEFFQKKRLDIVDKSLIDFLELLKAKLVDDPELYNTLGQPAPKALILSGFLGNNKTLSIQGISAWLGVYPENFQNFGPTELIQVWNGQTEKELRSLFDLALENNRQSGGISPLHLVHIEGIDTLFGSEEKPPKTHQVSQLSQLLTMLDEHRKDWPRLLIIATCDNPEGINPSLLRTGYFEDIFTIPEPKFYEREENFCIHTQLLRDKNLIPSEASNKHLANLTSGFSNLEIKSVVKGAFELADKRFRGNKAIPLFITLNDFLESIHTVQLRKNEKKEKIEHYFT
ncbi:MAG: ATP-binding protein [Parachlamydiales bacterium]|jgi:hypothetical protein